MPRLGLTRNMYLLPATLFVAAIGFACSGSGDDDDGGQCVADPDCDSCVQDGNCCEFTINCQPGSICNLPDDDLYDASKPEQTCVKVVCTNDSDCEAPKTCSLEKICKPPICQVDGDCEGGQVCRDGSCQTAPNSADVASCEVVSRDTSVREGGTITLQAIGYNANGKALAGVDYDWTSSNDAAVSVSGNTATGGSAAGTAMLTARPAGTSVDCARSVSITNFPNVPNTEVRVVVVADDNGEPVADANVTVDAGGTFTATTSADGSATVTVAAGTNPASVTVVKNGWQYVTVIAPGTNDVFIPLPRIADETKAGGFRGAVDLSATRRADIQLGLVGPAIPSNLLDFGLDALIGDFVPTEIKAPQLSLDVQEDLPAGLMLGLGSTQFMADEVRCQGDDPGANELGCFLARGPAGPSAGWALAGQLKLSAVTSIANDLSNVLGGGGDELPIGDLLTAVLPLLRSLNHAINPSVVIEEFDKVPREGQTVDCTDPTNAGDADLCQGDFSRYQKVPMAASSGLSVLSAVDVPDLPDLPAGGCASGMVLLAGASLEGRGLVPLGVTAGIDTLDDTQTADCKIAGVDKPFGENSAALPDGQMPLSMAPPHSGAEGSEVFLLLVALDIDSISADGAGLSLSALVHRADGGRVGAVENVNGSFLGYPSGTITKSTGTVEVTNTTGAKVTRVEVQRGDDTWLIYAPSSMGTINLPTVGGGPSDILANVGDAFVLTMGMPGDYSAMWQFGSGATLDRLFDYVEGFVIQDCDTAEGAACRIVD